MEYNNVGASHTGHRDVFITSDEMHLLSPQTTLVSSFSERMYCGNALMAENVSAHRCRRLATRIPPAYPTIDVGDELLSRR